MNTRRYLPLFLFLPLLSCQTVNNNVKSTSPATTLDKEIVSQVKNAVFEVVVPKLPGKNISYEKPLPMDQVPFAIRTDKYYSIGTAFAIGANKFATAAHVMNLLVDSQFKEVYLRDKEGKIYKLDKISKYSSYRDFVLFSLKDKKNAQFLEINDKPQINEKVFAVGNALGQGIVIRDGLYTSDTHEEEAGKWKWIRFSAAASPGNSGGPLLDKRGKVIGIVLMKSDNENLNYALPISEVLKAPVNTAEVHLMLQYKLDNMDMSKTGTLHKIIKLPKSFQALRREMIKLTGKFTGKLLKDLLAENDKNIFPKGKGSTELLHSVVGAVFPHLIMKGDDGQWSTYYPKDTKTAELGKNGYISYGSMNDTLYLYMKKPDNIPLKTFYEDSKLFMDLFLQGISLTRTIGSEQIKITSLGKAHEDFRHTDKYDRKWLVRTWLMEYSDEKIGAFMLPVPGGFIAMMKQAQTGYLDIAYMPDLKVFTDFIYLSYYGTIKEWKEFYSMKKLHPPVFSSIKIDAKPGKYVKYKSKKLSFSYTPDIMEISDDSYLQLSFSYYKSPKNVVWDVARVYAGEDKNNDTYLGVLRNTAPPKSLSDGYQSSWEKIMNRKFPYDSSLHYDDNGTRISSVYSNKSKKRSANNEDILYTVWFRKDGKARESEMKGKLNKFMRKLSIQKEPPSRRR
ncbi:MAG: serine protease [Deltaproteobacteria bacterium]|nr:serine protease [Deltaproteobacteria bacterium]